MTIITMPSITIMITTQHQQPPRLQQRLQPMEPGPSEGRRHP